VDQDGDSTAYGPVKSWTLYDGDDVYADLDSAGAIKSRYLNGPAVDMLLARYDSAGGQTTWYLDDRLGSVRALAQITGSSATVIDRIDYDAFGQLAGESNA